jgi:SAM-dependent methyltransferase
VIPPIRPRTRCHTVEEIDPEEGVMAAVMGTAQVQGELWSVRADDWAEVHEHNMRPVYEAALDLVHAGPGVSILEVGCGSGTALRLAADRGSHVTALDAAPAMVEHARRRVPGADVRVGDLQFLPYEDASFDAVLGFNSFQYAADPAEALREARRVLRPGGTVVAMVWGPADECELAPYLAALGTLLPSPPPGAPGPFALSAPGALRTLLVDAGFEVTLVADAAAAYAYADVETALRGLLSAGPAVRAASIAGDEATRTATREAIAPYVRPDGSVHTDNVWRFAIGRRA